jgi:colicin import membrane protein
VPDLTQPEAHDAWAAAVAAKEPWTQVEPWRTLWARSADAAAAEREAAQGASADAAAASAAAAAAAREAAEEARWAAVAARQELARRTALAVPSEVAASEAGAESPRSGWAGVGVSFVGPTRASASDEQTTQEVAAAMQSGNEAAAAERDAQERFINDHATRVRTLAAIRR